jgi:hypothetical protein
MPIATRATRAQRRKQVTAIQRLRRSCDTGIPMTVINALMEIQILCARGESLERIWEVCEECISHSKSRH